MGHARRKGPDRFQLLRPHQPFFHPLLFRDIDDISVKAHDVSGGCSARHTARSEMKSSSPFRAMALSSMCSVFSAAARWRQLEALISPIRMSHNSVTPPNMPPEPAVGFQDVAVLVDPENGMFHPFKERPDPLVGFDELGFVLLDRSAHPVEFHRQAPGSRPSIFRLHRGLRAGSRP